MTITAAREALRWTDAFPRRLRDLTPDEVAELDRVLPRNEGVMAETGAATLHEHPAPFAGFTHLLETSDGWRYHVTLADAD
jgi:hypothetical protein